MNHTDETAFKIGDIVEVDGETVYKMDIPTLRGAIVDISSGLFDIPIYTVHFNQCGFDFKFDLYHDHIRGGCPTCGNMREIFLWNCSICGSSFECIKCNLEHHYMHHPQNRL